MDLDADDDLVVGALGDGHERYFLLPRAEPVNCRPLASSSRQWIA